jgi:hypothetical protein
VTLISRRPSSAGRACAFAVFARSATIFSVSATVSAKPYQPCARVTARRYAGGVRPPTTIGTGTCTGRGIACTPSKLAYGPRCESFGRVHAACIAAR